MQDIDIRRRWHGMLPVVSADRRPSPVTVVIGDEELLVERAITAVVAVARLADADTDVRDLAGGALEPGQLAELTSPSLFGERRVLVVRDVEQLPKEVVDEVVASCRDVADEIVIVVVHKGGARGKPLLDAVLALGAERVDCAKITRPGERVDFVRAEFRTAGRAVTDNGARALIEAVGNDLRELAAACAQLCTDTDGQVDGELVARYYRGRAEASGFAVSDRALEGRLGEALEQLRWALGSRGRAGVDHQRPRAGHQGAGQGRERAPGATRRGACPRTGDAAVEGRSGQSSTAGMDADRRGRRR